MTRSRFAGWNFASALLFAIVTMVVGVFATPWLLQWLGEDRFGAYKAVIDWFGYLALLDFGILGAMQPLFAEALGKSDTSAMGLLVATGSRLYARVVGVMIVVGLIITSMITHLIPVPAPLTGELRIASLIVVAGLLLLPLSAPFRIVLESDQRGYRVNNLLVVQSLATTALSLGFAYYGGGIAGQALAVLIASLPYHLRLLTYGRRRFPREMRDAAAATPADAATARARLLSLNRPTFVLNLCGRVGLLSDNIVIAALLGPAAVVPFFATQRIAVMVQGQLQSLGNATWAGLAQLHAAGERELFNRRLVDLTGLVAALGVATLIPVIAFNEAFVTRWLGAQRFGGQALTLVAVLNAFLLSISSLWGWALNGTGRVEQIVRPFGIQTVVNLVMSIALTKALGLIGPMLGTTLGYLSVSIWYFPVLMHRAFGVSGGELRRAIAKPVLLGTPFGIATWMLARTYAPTGWLMLLAEMMLATACYLCAWWLVLLPKSERHLYTKRVAGVLRYQSA